MTFEEDLKDAEWVESEYAGQSSMLLNYRTKGDISFDVFYARDWPGGAKEGQSICRRLAAAMNYCRGRAVEELEGKS